jgi:hypothetical protein
MIGIPGLGLEFSMSVLYDNIDFIDPSMDPEILRELS